MREIAPTRAAGVPFEYNTSMNCLPESFFLADATVVARALLGKRLVRVVDGQRVSGVISETEAYCGEADMACHARKGKTRRNAVMYGVGGRAYIYFTYGMHWCLNAVCGAEGYPAAVLIRAILPQEGQDFIAARREGVSPALWCNGPAKLCKALSIDGVLNDTPLTDSKNPIFIEKGTRVAEREIYSSPRVGIQSAPEPWRSINWRYILSDQGSAR